MDFGEVIMKVIQYTSATKITRHAKEELAQKHNVINYTLVLCVVTVRILEMITTKKIFRESVYYVHT